MAEFMKANPKLQEAVAEMKPEEFQKFAGSMTEVMEGGPTPVMGGLPRVEQFFGFVQSLENPSRFLQGGFPGGTDGSGGFAKSDPEPETPAEPAEVEKAKDKDMDDEKKKDKKENPFAKSMEEAFTKAFAPIVAQLATLTAEVETVKKAAAGETPASEPEAAPETPTEDADVSKSKDDELPSFISFGDLSDEEEAEVVKSEEGKGYVNPRNPFGGMYDMAEIQLEKSAGKDSGIIQTRRQQGR